MALPLIDSHIHFSAHGRLQELEEYRQRIGAERICVLSLPARPRVNFNPEVLYAKASLGSRCYGLASFDYGSRWQSPRSNGGRTVADLRSQVDLFHALGFDGLKVFLGKPTFQHELALKLNDPEVLAALKRAEHLGMPALIHVADPVAFWSWRDVPDFVPPGWESLVSSGGKLDRVPSYEELQSQAVEVLRACPDLVVIFPHLLFMAQDLPRLSALLDRHPRLYLDLAPGRYFYSELHRQRAVAGEFFARYRTRILFGTDAFWFPAWFTAFPPGRTEENLESARQLLRFLATEEQMDNPFVPTRGIQATVRGLGLAQEILREICRNSFLRVFPPTPRALEPSGCREYLRGFVDRLAAVGTEVPIVNEATALMREANELLEERGG